MRQALGDRDLAARPCGGCRRGSGSSSSSPIAAASVGRVVHRVGLLQRCAAQRRRQRRRAEPVARPAAPAARAGGGRGAVAVGVEQPREQLLGGLARIELDQLLDLLAGQQQPRLQLQQRRDQDQELGGRLEIELARGCRDGRCRRSRPRPGRPRAGRSPRGGSASAAGRTARRTRRGRARGRRASRRRKLGIAAETLARARTGPTPIASADVGKRVRRRSRGPCRRPRRGSARAPARRRAAPGSARAPAPGTRPRRRPRPA